MIFMDFDDVISDCVGHLFRCHGVENPRFPVQTEAHTPTYLPKVAGLSYDELWAPYTPELVATQPMLPGAETFLKQLGGEWCFLTHIVAGFARLLPAKARWASIHFPGSAMIGTDHKEAFAAPGNVLIDDNRAACEKFEAAGGRAICFPAPWNTEHVPLDPYKHVLKLLAGLQL